MTDTKASRRQILAQIALADLPAPSRISFIDSDSILTIDLDSIGEGTQWAGFLHTECRPEFRPNLNAWSLSAEHADWLGWTVILGAWDYPGKGEALNAETRTALTALAETE